MNLLHAWLATPLAGAVGWALLHSLWEGALVAAVLAATLMATRSPRIRYAAGCVAMLLILGAFVVTLIRMMPEELHNSRVRPAAFSGWKAATSGGDSNLSNRDLAAAMPWLALFWAVGVGIFYLRHAAGWTLARRLKRRGVCCAAGRWQAEIAGLSARLGVSKPILLLESCLADAPLVLGHFRPVILMPVGLLTGLPAGQIEAILLHELAHIGRHDYLVNLLQRAAEGLLFYHPAVWWISRMIRAERENCCDDVAVALSGRTHEYASAIAALEENRRSGPELAVAATGGSLVKRIRRLLYPKGPASSWTPLAAGLILFATGAVALFAWQAEPSRQDSATVNMRAEGSPYVRWLNEDVVYIIADQERVAFQKLTTDDERNNFVAQFWDRRNPVPGAAENDFKKEHYRRIGYANQHFRTASGRPGWQTDRGHMYIVYGPPDEIESHAHGTPRPFEQWMYRHVEDIGDNVFLTFVDRAGTGDYNLAPGNAR